MTLIPMSSATVPPSVPARSEDSGRRQGDGGGASSIGGTLYKYENTGCRMTTNRYNYYFLKFYIFLLVIGSGLVSLSGQVRSREGEIERVCGREGIR